ncbi:MAG: hypothetical protein AB8F95_04630 [Bacteroidia bacterium]
MDNSIISKYSQLFDTLGLETKLELLSRLTASIQKGFNKKPNPDLLDELAGSWSDVEDNWRAIKPIKSSTSVEDMIIEQAYSPVNKEAFYDKTSKIKMDEPLEELLSMLD